MSTATELAALTERLANHMDYVEKSMDEAHRERQLAAEERRAIMTQLTLLTEDMKKVKPVTEMVDGLKAKITGAVLVLGFIGAVALGIVTYFKEQIHHFLFG